MGNLLLRTWTARRRGRSSFLNMPDKQKIIGHLVAAYKSGEKAAQLEIVYTGINKTFSMEIDGKQYSLTANQLADLPDGVGDELAEKIKSWAR